MFSRLFLGGIRQGIREGKEMEILTKSTFRVSAFFRGSLVRPWFLLGLIYVRDKEGTRDGNLNKSAFERKA